MGQEKEQESLSDEEKQALMTAVVTLTNAERVNVAKSISVFDDEDIGIMSSQQPWDQSAFLMEKVAQKEKFPELKEKLLELKQAKTGLSL